MTARDLAGVIGAALIAVAIIGILGRVSWDVAAPAGWFAAGVFVGFRAGQYARGYAHARGIRRSHWAAIRGEHR